VSAQTAQLGFWWLPALVSVFEQQNEDRRNREQIAANAAEQRRSERKQTLLDEQAKGKDLAEGYDYRLKALCKQWATLSERRKRGMNLDLLDQMQETHAMITKLKQDFTAWNARKGALESEIASLGGDEAPPTESYSVRAGESLSSIAGKVLGSIYRWKILADLNPQVKITQAPDGTPFSNLKVGDVIRIPSSRKPEPQKPPAQTPVLPVPPPSPPPAPESSGSGGAVLLVLAGVTGGGLLIYRALKQQKPKKKARKK
jgi:nucleoid-associated protein YgaU